MEFPCSFWISTNNNLALVQAACLGNGIVYLPEICIYDELFQQRLKIVLLEASDPESYGIFAIYSHRNAAAKVKVLVEFIERELSAMVATDRWAKPSKNSGQPMHATLEPA